MFVENHGLLSENWSAITIKSLLNSNANVWGLYQSTICRSDSCTLAKNVNHFISVTRHFNFNYLLTNVIQHIGIHIFNIYNYTDHK